jgi:hypothetical protein
MLVSLSKNSPATNSHRPVATIATTITNSRALRINSSTVQRGVLEIDAGEHLPVGVAGDPGATGAVAPLWHEAAVPAAVQGAPAHTQARLRLRARGAAEELLILDAGNEVALNVDQTGGNSAAPEWRAPFASASSARVQALGGMFSLPT